MGQERSLQELRAGDPSYVKWVLARTRKLIEEIEDFANYSIARRRLEAAALSVNSQQVSGILWRESQAYSVCSSSCSHS